MQQDFLDKLDYMLTEEEGLIEALKNTQAAKQLIEIRKAIIAHATKQYAQCQAKILGIALSRHHRQGQY